MKAILSLLVVLAPATSAADDGPADRATVPEPTILDCTKTKSISITKSRATYKVVGTCDKVAVTGSMNEVAIEVVKNLSITGSKNEIKVDKVAKIAALGSLNRVTYGAGLTTAAPKVASIGKNNVVRPATVGLGTVGTTPGAKPPPPPPPAVPAGAIDCSKPTTHTLDGNGTSHTFVGTCQLIIVNGNDMTIAVEASKGIYVAGNRNKLAVTSVDKLHVPGNDNTVTWKKPVSRAKAEVTVPGNRNKIRRAK